MTLNTLVNTMNGKPMLVTEAGFKAFKERLSSYSDETASPVAQPPYVKGNGIAVVNFCGFVVNSCTDLEAEIYGLVSLETFGNNLRKAVEDLEVEQVIVRFDSPGGYTMGLVETSALIKKLGEQKPIHAFTSGLMCSAAYNVACNMPNLVASPSSLVGSIGVYAEYFTYNGSSTLGENGVTESVLPDFGLTVTTFQGGSDKTIGSEFIKLSDSQKADIAAGITKEWDAFKAHVKANRGNVKDEAMKGNVFTGLEAEQNNLVDGVSNSLQDFVEGLLSMKAEQV